jgi:hypothetical protein
MPAVNINPEQRRSARSIGFCLKKPGEDGVEVLFRTWGERGAPIKELILAEASSGLSCALLPLLASIWAFGFLIGGQ